MELEGHKSTPEDMSSPQHVGHTAQHLTTKPSGTQRHPVIHMDGTGTSNVWVSTRGNNKRRSKKEGEDHHSHFAWSSGPKDPVYLSYLSIDRFLHSQE